MEADPVSAGLGGGSSNAAPLMDRIQSPLWRWAGRLLKWLGLDKFWAATCRFFFARRLKYKGAEKTWSPTLDGGAINRVNQSWIPYRNTMGLRASFGNPDRDDRPFSRDYGFDRKSADELRDEVRPLMENDFEAVLASTHHILDTMKRELIAHRAEWRSIGQWRHRIRRFSPRGLRGSGAGCLEAAISMVDCRCSRGRATAPLARKFLLRLSSSRLTIPLPFRYRITFL